jgi:hypothetical protein
MTITQASVPSPYFDLTFCPSVELISVVRRFVSSFFDHLLADPDATSRLALTTHELLENATKCSPDGVISLRIDLTPEDDSVRIRTWNRAVEEHMAILKGHFEEMLDVSDPQSYYQQMIERSAKRKTGSGLGLARLLAEAEMRLTYEIEGDRVCITAVTRALQKERPT